MIYYYRVTNYPNSALLPIPVSEFEITGSFDLAMEAAKHFVKQLVTGAYFPLLINVYCSYAELDRDKFKKLGSYKISYDDLYAWKGEIMECSIEGCINPITDYSHCKLCNACYIYTLENDRYINAFLPRRGSVFNGKELDEMKRLLLYTSISIRYAPFIRVLQSLCDRAIKNRNRRNY